MGECRDARVESKTDADLCEFNQYFIKCLLGLGMKSSVKGLTVNPSAETSSSNQNRYDEIPYR